MSAYPLLRYSCLKGLDASHLARKFFQPPPVSIRNSLATRMVRSEANVWFFYLGAKIFEQLNKSSRDAAVRPFVHWINNCDEHVENALKPNLSVEELENHLLGLLEVSFRHNAHLQHDVLIQSLACVLEVRGNQHASRLLLALSICPCFHRLSVQRP